MTLTSRSLRARLLWLGLIATLPALIVIVVSQSLERGRAREGVVEDVRHVTQLIASQQATVFDGVVRLLSTLSQFPAVRAADPRACEGLLPRILRDHPNYIDLWIVDPDGTPFCAGIPAGPGVAVSNRTRTWFQRAMAARTTVVGDFQVGVVSHQPDLVIAQPLLGPSGDVQRIMAVSIGLGQLKEVATQARLPSGFTLTLFDRSDTIVARVPDGQASLGQRIPATMRPAGDSREVFDITGSDGRAQLYLTARVRQAFDTGLTVGLSVDRDIAFAPANALFRRQLLLLLLVVVGAIAVALMGGEWFVARPISALTDVTRRLAGGDLSARARLSAAAPGLSELTASLNDMARDLEARQLAREQTEARLRASEEKLRHAQKLEAVGQIAAGVAHNFNNLLAVIVGFAELLRIRHGGSERDQLDVDEINKAARRGATLARQLLTFSRKQMSAPAIVDLNRTVSDMRDVILQLIRDDIALTIEIPATPSWVYVDPQDVEQVISNLVSNGRDAQPSGGRIAIAIAHTAVDPDGVPPAGASSSRRYVAIHVRDEGSGMSPEVQAHLFEPFFTTKEVGQGTGLGLATVDGIVRQNGGFVAVDSAVGRGSSFTVHFPYAEEPPETPPAGDDAVPSTSEHRHDATILLVEDEEALRTIATRALVGAGYRVITAGSPTEAWELFTTAAEITAIVTDVVMPEMNGPALVQRLRTRKPDLRVLFISGYSENDPVVGMSGEFCAFLEKPFSPRVLVQRVRDLLSGERLDTGDIATPHAN